MSNIQMEEKMGELSTVMFKGVSGSQYNFRVYTWDTTFKAVGAVYVVTRRYLQNGRYYYDNIYVGQTGDLSERFDDHHKAFCFRNHRANCICVHVEGNRSHRLAIETDLIRALRPPCNN